MQIKDKYTEMRPHTRVHEEDLYKKSLYKYPYSSYTFLRLRSSQFQF